MNLLDRISSISIGSSDVQPSESPYLPVLFIGTSQSRQHDKSESCVKNKHNLYSVLTRLIDDLLALDSIVRFDLSERRLEQTATFSIPTISDLLDHKIQQLSKGLSEGSGTTLEVPDEPKDNSVVAEKQAGHVQTNLTLSSAELEIQSMVDVPIHQEDLAIR
ncbi:hypothetical protein Tco_0140720 [Tanacetum coccineum]